MRRGFTLAELLMVVVILGVLALVAFPGFSKSQAKNDAREAITYLRAIRLAELTHFAKTGAYVGMETSGWNWGAILGVDIPARQNVYGGKRYAYQVSAPGGASFQAMAGPRELNSRPASCDEPDTICLDQRGVWSGHSAYLPQD